MSLSPLYVTTWPSASTTADIVEYMDVAYGWAASLEQPWGLIYDLSAFDRKGSSAERRKAFADGARRLSQQLESHCVGVSAVMPTAVLRGIATALLWVYTPPMPIRLFSTREAAINWQWGLLGDAYAEMPSSRA